MVEMFNSSYHPFFEPFLLPRTHYPGGRVRAEKATGRHIIHIQDKIHSQLSVMHVS